MQFRTYSIEGLLEIVPHKVGDDRGYFSEVFRRDAFDAKVPGIEFVQDNQSLSVKAGTIRGIHFQSHPAAQGKLVRCIAGKLFDVAVDLRRGSPTFGQWQSVILTPEACNQFWVPVGFGHAFCSLEPNSVISYRVSEYYSAENDRGVSWDDPDIGVDWPAVTDASTLSPKDRKQPRLADLQAYF
jgi:dTDP-4-dehydrorhamnose 3,5-epimerase